LPVSPGGDDGGDTGRGGAGAVCTTVAQFAGPGMAIDMDKKELHLVSLVLALIRAIAHLYTAVLFMTEDSSHDPRVKASLEIVINMIDECNKTAQDLISEMVKNGGG